MNSKSKKQTNIGLFTTLCIISLGLALACPNNNETGNPSSACINQFFPLCYDRIQREDYYEDGANDTVTNQFYTYTYVNGRMVRENWYLDEATDTALNTYVTYNFSSNGEIQRENRYTDGASDREVNEYYVYTYNSGNVVRTDAYTDGATDTVANSYRTYTYDANNRLVRRYNYFDGANDAVPNAYYVYTYNNSGNVIRTDFYGDGANDTTVNWYDTYTYNNSGNVIRSNFYGDGANDTIVDSYGTYTYSNSSSSSSRVCTNNPMQVSYATWSSGTCSSNIRCSTGMVRCRGTLSDNFFASNLSIGDCSCTSGGATLQCGTTTNPDINNGCQSSVPWSCNNTSTCFSTENACNASTDCD